MPVLVALVATRLYSPRWWRVAQPTAERSKVPTSSSSFPGETSALSTLRLFGRSVHQSKAATTLRAVYKDKSLLPFYWSTRFSGNLSFLTLPPTIGCQEAGNRQQATLSPHWTTKFAGTYVRHGRWFVERTLFVKKKNLFCVRIQVSWLEVQIFQNMFFFPVRMLNSN